MPSDNKQIVRAFIEQVVNTGNLEAMDALVAEDIIDHNNEPGSPQGIAVYKEHLSAVLYTYGEFHLAIEDQFADREYVITRITATGIHQNEWLGLQPTGDRITLTGINIDRVRAGKITEHWGEANTIGAVFQMGAKIVPANDASSKP
jgi:predicted ester cyclase